MTRKKVKLAFVIDYNARKATFRKRKKGIMKKVSELSALCGIQACAIITSPFDSHIETWPNPEKAKQVIEKYQNSSVIDESKNVTQERLIMQQISKAKDKLEKQRKENREKEMTLAMFKCMKTGELPKNLNNKDLKYLGNLFEQYMKDIEDKVVFG